MLISAIAEPEALPNAIDGRVVRQLLLEAEKAQALGKTFISAVLASLSRVLPVAPHVLLAMEEWPGDLARAGVIFRLNAGVHALARSGDHPGLAMLYRHARADRAPEPLLLDIALSLALQDGGEDLLEWLARPTQTNEVGRIAGLAAVLMELDARRPMRTNLLELGTSAGLNLNLEHYDIHVGTRRCGDPGSAVLVAPRWTGPSPLPGRPRLSRAEGVDLHPLDVRREHDAERLQSYIWPGEPERSERLRAAIAIARLRPPCVKRGRASAWLATRLPEPQPEGTRRVVFHSMVLQYMPPAERRAVDQAIALAGARASASRPLVRVGLEWNAERSAVEVTVTQWDGSMGSGQHVVAARCHPYAEWFEWIGLRA